MTTMLPTRRWTRTEYEQLIGLGVLKPEEHVELLDGALVVREPRLMAHAAAVRAVHGALRAVFGPEWQIHSQRPVALDADSEPEPDVAVVPGSHGSRFLHPSRPVLVVEVVEAAVAARRVKGGLYARAAVEELWIVNLVDEVLEVYRRPDFSRLARFRWVYADTQGLRRGDVVAPLAARDARVSVADLFGSEPP